MPWALGKDASEAARAWRPSCTTCCENAAYHFDFDRSVYAGNRSEDPGSRSALFREVLTYESAVQVGLAPADRRGQQGETLFPRIDVEKEIEELNKLLPNRAEPRAKSTLRASAQIGIDDIRESGAARGKGQGLRADQTRKEAPEAHTGRRRRGAAWSLPALPPGTSRRI